MQRTNKTKVTLLEERKKVVFEDNRGMLVWFLPHFVCNAAIFVARRSLSSWDGQGSARAVRSLRLAIEEQGGERPGSAFTALLR